MAHLGHEPCLSFESAFGTKTDVGGQDRGGLLTQRGHPCALQHRTAQSPKRTR
jgi:hypothetical protein